MRFRIIVNAPTKQATFVSRALQDRKEQTTSAAGSTTTTTMSGNGNSNRPSRNNYPSKRSKIDLQYQNDNIKAERESSSRNNDDGDGDGYNNNSNGNSNSNSNNIKNSNSSKSKIVKKMEDKKIYEVFQENYKAICDDAKNAKKAQSAPMDGDLPALALRHMFVMGVKVGWPYPEMLPPQRQMGTHIIRALKASKHVVLESPTGTGKSAAILCSVLAWQRYHHCTQNHETVQIIYCSRTHSQVAQMVTSLLATPYRPSMTVLGSRDRMCIHETITNPTRKGKKKDVNVECRNRVKATDAYRKRTLRKQQDPDNRSSATYNDNDPIPFLPSDEYEDVTVNAETNREMKPTCQHYRQMSTNRTAKSVYDAFRPKDSSRTPTTNGTREKANFNSSTKDGTHDIEDLVQFGKNPYKRIVTLKRKCVTTEPWGIKISFNKKSEKYPTIVSLIPNGIGSKCNELRVHDQMLSINGILLSNKTLQDVSILMKSKLMLVMSITNSAETTQHTSGHTDTYSTHSSCPYYISRRLVANAELVFCPYNYILDPSIRSAMKLSIDNKVIVLDEAHNVESTLRESGSGSWSEFVLCEIMEALVYEIHANRAYNGNPATMPTESMSKMAHAIVEFIEPALLYLFDAKVFFETKGGAKKAILDWERFNTIDTETFEMSYDGPNGHGVNGKIMGCNAFFEHKMKIKLEHGQGEVLRFYCEKLQESNQMSTVFLDQQRAATFEKLVDLVGKLTHAHDTPQHYFIQTNVQANGSFSYAAGVDPMDTNRRRKQPQQSRRNPKALPMAANRSRRVNAGDVPRDVCPHCKKNAEGHKLICQHGVVRHGSYNNGSKPAWETTLVLDLLTPSVNMADLAKQCRSIILASGSLAPLPSLCAELGLYPAEEEETALKSETPATKNVKSESKVKNEPKREKMAKVDGELSIDDVTAAVRTNLKKDAEAEAEEKSGRRLQVKPPPLEANHVINLEKQLFAVAIGQFPNGDSLTVRYSEYKHDAFIHKLGDALASVVESIPSGGVLIFLPSYSFLGRCTKAWNPELHPYSRSHGQNSASPNTGDTWDRLIRSKGKVMVEPTGTQSDFEEARDEYAETIRSTKKCVMFAVFRGKMSEGISFNDDNARGVICVGIPYPSSFSRSIKAKQSYNDEQRKVGKRTDMLTGKDWYAQQAHRAVAQALGRCIRHVGDYGTVVLLDSRYSDESPPDRDGVCAKHRFLPKWMRGCVRSLVRKTRHAGVGHDEKLVGDGWGGLQTELRAFFGQAPGFTEGVLEQQAQKLADAQHRASSSETLFNASTGNWSLSQPSPAVAASTTNPDVVAVAVVATSVSTSTTSNTTTNVNEHAFPY